MFRAIKPNKYKFSDIQITESVISFTERNLQYAANFTQNTRNLQYTANFPKSFVYLQRISFLAIKIECKMNSKVNK